MININIAELLRNCPKGTELYSPIFGDVYLDEIRPHLAVVVRTSDEQKEEFSYDGRFGINGECMLFPSKENRDWSTFQRPFKDGDIVYVRITFKWIAIYKELEKGRNEIGRYASIRLHSRFNNEYILFDNRPLCHNKDVNEIRLATEEEKEKLFQAIKENGYRWNAEKRELEKLIVPQFKVRDKIKKKKDYISGIITDINDGTYKVEYKSGGVSYVNIEFQDDWELVPNKFDINTLKPFDKVLVRDNNEYCWHATFYSHHTGTYFYSTNGLYAQCIPFEDNKHLLGTTNDCNEYYKSWEE